MAMKRKPIQKRIRRILLILCASLLLITAVTSGIALLTLLNRVKSDSEELGFDSEVIGELMLYSEISSAYGTLAESKAQQTRIELDLYANYLSQSVHYLSWLCANRDSVAAPPVLPPDASMSGEFTMQRMLLSEDVSLSDVAEEAGFLGTMEQLWEPIIRANENEVSNIYLGTVSGLMISYDAVPETKDIRAGEAYYDFSASPWYTAAMGAGELTFTDAYMDNFGRGPTITCAAPFYDENGKIAGVVAMDLRISSFTRNIVTTDDYNFQTAIVDSDGRIVAAADLSESDTFLSLEDTTLGDMRHDILSGDEGSVINEDNFVSFVPVPRPTGS